MEIDWTPYMQRVQLYSGEERDYILIKVVILLRGAGLRNGGLIGLALPCDSTNY